MSSPFSHAFVLGAGFGSRLKTLTARRPKPLIPMAGKPLITYGLDYLVGAGVEHLIVNTHHCASLYGRLFPGGEYAGARLLFRHETELLETGGGIKNVEDLLPDAPFLVYNGDVLTTLPLAPLLARHLSSGHEATLVLRSHGGPLQVAFAPAFAPPAAQQPHADAAPSPVAGQVVDIGQRLGRSPGTHLFTGIYALSPAFLRRLERKKVSVIETFLSMLRQGAPVGAVVIDEGSWWDIGSREAYLDFHRAWRAAHPLAPCVHPEAQVHRLARLTGATYVGAGTTVGPHARLHDTIVWEGVSIAPQSRLTHCVVSDQTVVEGIHANVDF